MASRLQGITRLLSRRKKQLSLVILWGIVLGLIVIKVYWTGYQEIKWLKAYRVPYGWYETPQPVFLDLVLVLLASLIVGLLISDAKFLFYGYIMGLLLTFMVSFVYVMIYMWTELGLADMFTLGAFDWEWAVLFSIWNVGKLMFPQVVLLSLLGVISGAMLREVVGY
jgi:hypothetical protein